MHGQVGQTQKNTLFCSLSAYITLRAYSCIHYEMYAIKSAQDVHCSQVNIAVGASAPAFPDFMLPGSNFVDFFFLILHLSNRVSNGFEHIWDKNAILSTY